MTAYFRQNVIYKTEKFKLRLLLPQNKKKSPVICIQTVTGFPLPFFITLYLYTLIFSHALFPLRLFSAVFPKSALSTISLPVSSPSPASHHTHPICCGPAVCFLSSRIYRKTEVVRVFIYQSVSRIAFIHDIQQCHPVIIIRTPSKAQPLSGISQPIIVLPCRSKIITLTVRYTFQCRFVHKSICRNLLQRQQTAVIIATAVYFPFHQ